MLINMSDHVKVPILKADGVTLPFKSASNYEGWVSYEVSFLKDTSLLCVVAPEDLDIRARIKQGDCLIVAVGLYPEIGEYAVGICDGTPIVGVVVDNGETLALDVQKTRPIPFDDQNVFVGSVVAMIRKF